MIFFSPPEFNGVIILCQYYKDIGVLLQQIKLPRIDGNITINKGGRRRRKAGGGGGDGRTMTTTTATTLATPDTTQR